MKTIVLFLACLTPAFVVAQHNLGTTNWTNLETTPTDDGTNKTVTVSPPAGNRFYRLSRQ